MLRTRHAPSRAFFSPSVSAFPFSLSQSCFLYAHSVRTISSVTNPSIFASASVIPSTYLVKNPEHHISFERSKSSVLGMLKQRRIWQKAINRKKPSKNQLRKRAEALAKEKAEEVFKDQVHGTRCTNTWLQGRVIWFEAENKEGGVDFLSMVEEKEQETPTKKIETARYPDSNQEVVVFKRKPKKKKRTTVATKS